MRPIPGGGRPVMVAVRAVIGNWARAFRQVLLAVASIAASVVALWVALALAHASGSTTAAPARSGWTWALAVFVTLVSPLLLALWKHQGHPRRISATMTWLPLIWNAGGLLLAHQFIPDLTAVALRHHGAWMMAAKLGDSHSATRVLSALGHHAADVVRHAAADERAPSPPSLVGDEPTELDHTITVPFSEEGTAIVMNVTLEGPRGQLTLPYLFDTGASFTTISRSVADQLGIAVPEDAPTLKFNTASGPRESRMVYVPMLQFDRTRIAGLLASVCDDCVNERTQGLLGLNVMREFFVQMDYKNERMSLLPRTHASRPNRAYDIEPVLELQIEGTPEVWLGRVRWVILVKNRGSVPVLDVVPTVRFTDGPVLRGAPIEWIAPGEVGRSLVEGRSTATGQAESGGLFTLGVAEAYW